MFLADDVKIVALQLLLLLVGGLLAGDAADLDDDYGDVHNDIVVANGLN